MKETKPREYNSPIMQELIDETTPEEMIQTQIEMELVSYSVWLLKHYDIKTENGVVGYVNSMGEHVPHWDVVFHYLKSEEKI